MRNWEQVFSLPWRQRDAEIESAVRQFLADTPNTFTTFEIAELLGGQEWRKELIMRLGTMAPYMAPYAKHDGEEFTRYGRKMRRWNWYGQANNGGKE